MPDTSIVPAWTVGSANFQYVIGRDNGLADQPSTLRLDPPYANSDVAHAMFLAQISSPVVIRFEEPEFTINDQPPFVIDLTTTTATIANAPGSGLANFICGSHQPESFPLPYVRSVGRYAPWGPEGETVPTNDWQFLNASRPVSVSFSVPVRAFGFFGVDLGDWDGVMPVKIFYSDATTETWLPPYTLSGTTTGGAAPWNQSMTFIGMVFTKDVDEIQLLNSSSGVDVFGFDNFTAAISSQVTLPPGEVEPPIVPRAPLDCVPSFGGQPCPPECPITVPTQTLSTGTPSGGPHPAVYAVVETACAPGFQIVPTVPDCPITIPAQTLSTGVAVLPPPTTSEPFYILTLFPWFSGFGSGTPGPGVPSVTVACGPSFSSQPSERQCAA